MFHKLIFDSLIYHSKANISFLESWAVVGTVTGDSHNFTTVGQLAVNDALNQRVLVRRRRTCQHSQLGPNFVQ